mmetsp:Transcript_149124/g.263388  ORF Transcript_149124/g.263388 Transcript_149124/m.263388 type:complete len:88 (-) Transcript_149124:169-432(-)
MRHLASMALRRERQQRRVTNTGACLQGLAARGAPVNTEQALRGGLLSSLDGRGLEDDDCQCCCEPRLRPMVRNDVERACQRTESQAE